ncbi:MAG: transporter associated domain-containing protein, partial [Anaerovibrio sp.]|nr:transporter associated domain-containing protein [Anaerovibrio sp.]
FEKKEQNLVDRVFHMSDQTAYSLMTPRTQVMWIDLTDSLEQNMTLIRATSEAIIPVGRESLDDFCGVIYIKDVFNAALDNQPLDLTKFIRKPMVIPRSMESFRILEQFQETGIHEAAVLDEYGGVIGFITLQDILLELIGDTNNINEPELAQITSRDDNSWNIDGLCSIDDFKDKFDIDELPDEDQDHYQTMGGFVTALFGYIPKKDESVQWEQFIFRIEGLDKYRINKIICTLQEQEKE